MPAVGEDGPGRGHLCHTDTFLVLYLTLCYFVFVFFSPFSIAITSLGEERANLNAFRTFVRFVLVWFCRFPLPLGVWEGLRFVIVALPGLPFMTYILTIYNTCTSHTILISRLLHKNVNTTAFAGGRYSVCNGFVSKLCTLVVRIDAFTYINFVWREIVFIFSSI